MRLDYIQLDERTPAEDTPNSAKRILADEGEMWREKLPNENMEFVSVWGFPANNK